MKFTSDKLSLPISLLKSIYDEAMPLKNIEALCLSTCGNDLKPSSRLVNIKYITSNSLIFFSNYNSRKSLQINENNSISGLFFWNKVNIQIRLEGEIYNLNSTLSDKHFKNRSFEKNILAISSSQSKEVENYERVKKNYKKIYDKYKGCELKRPSYWGGFEIIPNYFEFWYGHKNRLNKRLRYRLKNNEWIEDYLQP